MAWLPITALLAFTLVEGVQFLVRSVLLVELLLSDQSWLVQPHPMWLVAEQLLGLAGMGFFLLSALLWLIWEATAYSSMTRIEGASWSSSPALVAGWWFVPGLHLVRPIRLMQELWRNAVEESERPSDESPRLLRVWWRLWGLTQGLWLLAWLLTEEPGTIRLDAAADWLFSAVSALAALAAAAVVLSVDRRLKRYSMVQVLPP